MWRISRPVWEDFPFLRTLSEISEQGMLTKQHPVFAYRHGLYKMPARRLHMGHLYPQKDKIYGSLTAFLEIFARCSETRNCLA
jgi:hypothetical protein